MVTATTMHLFLKNVNMVVLQYTHSSPFESPVLTNINIIVYSLVYLRTAHHMRTKLPSRRVDSECGENGANVAKNQGFTHHPTQISLLHITLATLG